MRETPSVTGGDGRDIPVLIDDVKELGTFNMTRCTFFRIEAGAAVIDYVATLRGLGVPFTIFGSTSVIDRPASRTPYFESPEQIERLFDRVEGVEGLVVETAHLWLPNNLFDRGSEAKASYPRTDRDSLRGSLWRVSRNLFALALQFRREMIGAARFHQRCQELIRFNRNALRISPDESEVFRRWSAEQIRASQRNYEENLQKQGLALPWRDEEGNLHAG